MAMRGDAALNVVYSQYTVSGPTLAQIGVQVFFFVAACFIVLLCLDAPHSRSAVACSNFVTNFLRIHVSSTFPRLLFAAMLLLPR